MSELKFDDWVFECRANTPILNSKQIAKLADEFSFPLPGILFGDNQLLVRNTRANLSLSFNLHDCLKGIPRTPSLHSVFAAKEWKPSGSISLQKSSDPYDWTYYSTYEGTLVANNEWNESTQLDGIDVDLLKEQNDFLFFRSLLLFEDELADSGHTSYSVKIRVMPKFFLILAICACRIDFVWEGRREMRYFHVFGSKRLVKNVRVYSDGNLVEQREFNLSITC